MDEHYILNLLNCYRHKYNQLISRIFLIEFLAGFWFLAQLCACDSELFPLSQSGQLRYSQLNSLNSTGQFSWAQSRRTDIDSGGATAAPSGSRYLYCHFTDFFFNSKFGGKIQCRVLDSFETQMSSNYRSSNLSVCKSNFDKIL